MIKINKIFVVINPTTDDQYALWRAAEIAKHRKAEIFAFVCIYSPMQTSDLEKLKEAEIARYQPWLDKLVQPIKKQGIKVRTGIAWNQVWHKVLVVEVKRERPDMIVKATRRNPNSHKLQMLTSDWALFENATCPVLLVNPRSTKPKPRSTKPKNILVAVDINRADSKYQALLELIIEYANSIANSTGSKLHVVNSYIGQEDYVHVTDVADRVGIPNKNVHVIGGHPEQAILQVSEQVNADLVIIGLSTKSKLRSRIFGYTSEWLLHRLCLDVFVVIPKK